MKLFRRYRRSLSVLLMAAMLFTSFTVVSFGASGTKKTTLYSDVLVSGSYAYCSVPTGIYRVNLKTNKVQRIVDNSEDYEITGALFGMKIHKKYLYYMSTGGVGSPLYRIRKSGGKAKFLDVVYDYAIKNGKIYYECYDYKKENNAKKVMKLNGKSKRKSSYKVKAKYKKTNKKGYSLRYVNTGKREYYADYEEYLPVIESYLVRPGKSNVLINRFFDVNEIY